MNLAFCDECVPAAVIGVNVGSGCATHAVNGHVHKAKLVSVAAALDDLQKDGETLQVYMERLGKKYRDSFEAGTVPVTSYHGPSFEVAGGLGDVLHNLHHMDKYSSLMSLGPKERRLIVVMSHNPHAKELFLWHPKAKQLDVVYIGYRAPWGPEQRKKLGLPEPMIDHHRVPTPIEYYPSPEDRAPLAQLCRMKYVAFCLTGSNNNDRDIPLPFAEKAADEALKMGLEVVILGRNYRTIAMHGTARVEWPHVEPQLKPRAGLTSMVDRLTVPGTCRALAMAEAVFCAHSALCLASWWLRRPTFVVYNEGQSHLFKHPLGYAFGRDFPETRHKSHTQFTIEQFREWLGRVKIGDYGRGGR